MLFGIHEDPDHPDLIILFGNSIRDYVFQASDENYEWKMTVQWSWQEGHETDEMFFYPTYFTGATLYTLQATLSNYFQYGFGSQVRLPAFDIVTNQESHEFSKEENKVIQVAVLFRSRGDRVKLLDLGQGLDFWGLRTVDPEGERTSVPAAIVEVVYNSEDREETRRMYRVQHDLVYQKVDSTHPYTRSIDIGSLYDFSIAGTYRVQLFYDSSWLANRNRGEWPGSFSGHVFTVTIKEN